MGFLCNIAESNEDKKTAAESLICFPRGYTQSDKIFDYFWPQRDFKNCMCTKTRAIILDDLLYFSD